MSSERVENYRRRVIDHVACPHCFAQIQQPCHKPQWFPHEAHLLDYVHDDRSAEFEQHQLALIADRGLPSIS